MGESAGTACRTGGTDVFDYAHRKSIHRHPFQDMYEWAGQERIGPYTRTTKEGPDVVRYPLGYPRAPVVACGYYPGPQDPEAAEPQYRLLAGEEHLQGLIRAAFIGRLAEHRGEPSTVHSLAVTRGRAYGST